MLHGNIQELEVRADLVKLDRELLIPANVRYGAIEACDFFSDQKAFIHLKDGHSSSMISHLWMQGVVSAEAFVNDSKFRGDLRKKVKQRKPGFESHLPMANQQPERPDYKVVFGIMRQPYRDGSLGLPFFSKVSLCTAIESFQKLNVPVALNLIKKVEAGAIENDEEEA